MCTPNRFFAVALGCVMLLCISLPVYAQTDFIDTNYDGIDDNEALSDSIQTDWPDAMPALNPSEHFQFNKVWESYISPGAVHEAILGDLDQDGKTEIIFPSYHWPPGNTFIHIYENNGDNIYEEVWISDSLYRGVVLAFEIDDLDNDGNLELIMGHYADKVQIYENDGDNSFAKWTPQAVQGIETIKDIEIADTDLDGIKEILVQKYENLYIYENGYKIFEKYLGYNIRATEVKVGDLDNDTYPEIVIVRGTWNPSINYVEILEYNGQEYESKYISLPEFTKGPSTAEISDLNNDGLNELILGGMMLDDKWQIVVINSVGNDLYEVTSATPFPDNMPLINNLSLSNVMGSDSPELTVATSRRDYVTRFCLFTYNGNGFDLVYISGSEYEESLSYFNSANQGLLDDDNLPDILIGTGYNAFVVEGSGILLCGDTDGDFGLDLIDITLLIDFIYNNGQTPPALENADTNSSGTIDIIDIVILINYLFLNGPRPNCN